MEISQRLKRAPTMIDKLVREPNMQLSTMQDIGGCRAVLASIDQVRAVERRLKKNRHPIRVYDYITTPRASVPDELIADMGRLRALAVPYMGGPRQQ